MIRVDIKKNKVLLVEDEAICRRTESLILLAHGMDVDIAETGLKAIELVKRVQYGVIFLDLGLPDIKGEDVSLLIKSSGSLNVETPIVILTAHSAGKKIEGIDDFLTKPLSKTDAAAALKKHLLGPSYHLDCKL